MRTPAEEAEYQQLGHQLGFFGNAAQAAPAEPNDGILSFTGKHLANILPSAAEKVIQPFQAIMGGGREDLGPLTEVPRFFDAPAPKGIAQNVIAGGAELASYLPAILMTEGLGTGALGALGMGARAAKIGGAGLGFALPMAPQGAETAAVQGGVGSVLQAAQSMGWRGKVAAGLLAGGAGYYEGQKQSPEMGLIYGGLNLAAPTIIDPIINKMFGMPKQGGRPAPTPTDIGGGRPIEGQPIPFRLKPDEPTPPTPGLQLGGQGPLQPAPAGIPFYDPGMPLPIGQAKPEPVPTMRLDPNHGIIRPFQSQDLGMSAGEAGLNFGNRPYNTDPYDAFAGLQKVPDQRPLSPMEQEARLHYEGQKAAKAAAPVPPAPVTTSLPSEHPSIATGLMKLLQDDPGWTPPGTPLKPGFTEEAFALGDRAKTPADIKRMRSAASKYGKAANKAMDNASTEADFQRAQEFANRQQYLTEAAEYAEGMPEKLAVFRRRNPDYKPSVPSQAYKDMEAAGVTSPIPKAGDPAMHWSEEGMPLDVTVDKVEGNLVHYTENDLMTGQSNKKVATLQEFDNLQKMPEDRAPNPKQPVGPAPSGDTKVRVMGKYGMETGSVIARDADTVTVRVEDPIFGAREQKYLVSDTHPVTEPIPTPKGGRPFEDIESAKLRGSEGARGAAQAGESEADLLGSIMEGDIGGAKKSIPGKETLTFQEGLKHLPAEAGRIVSEIFARMQTAAGKPIETFFSLKMPGAKAGAYKISGRVAFNLQWVNGVLKNWTKMNAETQGRVLMRMSALFGHEITHVAQIFGEKSDLLVNGKPVLDAIVENVKALSKGQREYIQLEIQKMKGDLSTQVNRYLAGDVEAVGAHYRKANPHLTDAQVEQLAAGELLAELGAVELIRRTNVDGLPGPFRAAVDKFKQVLIKVIDYFRGQSQHEGVAALQSLQSITAKMYDHFGSADNAAVAKAFPASSIYDKPLPSGSSTPTPAPPQAPVGVSVANGPLLKSEIARLGIRATVGGALGGIIGPQVGPNQVSTAEGILLGSIAGVFGPSIAKKLLTTNLVQEVKEAVVASKGNPLKTMASIMGGKSLRDLGLEGRFGWTGESNTMAKFVRTLESEFNLNLDPKLKALVEEGRGNGQLVLAGVQDALDKVRWYKPDPVMLEAVDKYFTGKMSKEEFQALLTSPELRTYGDFIVTAREGMTTLTNMFASGMARSKFRDHLIETADKYLGRFYSAYKEGKFNMEAFDKAKADFRAKFGSEYSDEMADNMMREYMREIQANRNLFGRRRGNSGQKIDASTTYKRLATEEEIEAQKIVVGGLEHAPYSQEFLKEKGLLDWMETHKVTDNWRDWLGEYKNPIERMIYSFQKLYPSGISAKIFDLLDNRVGSDGLKFSYTAKELEQTRSLIENEIGKVADPKEVARLQNQLKELSGYGALPEGSAYGKLAKKWVNRFVRDEVNTYATPFKWMEQPVLRSIAEFNNLVKLTRTAYNPLTVIRNYIQLPMMALISKTKAGDIGEAWNIIHRLKNDDYKLMLQRHIIGSDFVSAELSKGPGRIFSGYMDSDIAIKAAKYGHNLVLKNYQQPDMLQRAGAFLSARRRFAERAVEEGRFASVQEAAKHESVIDQAVEFTQRYTMNYDTVPRIVKAGRQLPFVNLFISYTSEITRILKNLTEDAIRPGPDSAGRMHAITVLGAMAAIPAMMVASFEGNLSPKDRSDWEKVKKLSPEYTRARFRIPTGRDKEGRFRYFDITNLLPADNYSQMIKAFANGDTEAALAANPLVSLQNTPLLNMAAEQIAGEDLRTGRKIEGYGRVREVLKETLPPILPPGYEGQRISNAFSRNAQGELGITNTKSGVQYNPSDVIASYITGMRFGNISLDAVQKQAVSKTKGEIAIQKALLNDILRTDLPQSEKERAIKIHNETVTQLMLELHSKLGVSDSPR